MTSSTMNRAAALVLLVGMVPLVGCGEPESGGLPSTLPRFEDATFSDPTIIDNPLHPLLPGFVRLYFADTSEGLETTVAETLDETREVDRVESRVVVDRVFLDDELVRTTTAWVAQDEERNVWLMGEQVQTLEATVAWEAGTDMADVGSDAHPGWLMPANPQAGDAFHRAYYPGVIEDVVEVLARDVGVTLDDGTIYSTLQTHRTTRLDPDLDLEESYAAGVGEVLESRVATEEKAELVATFRPGLISVPSFATVSFDAPTTIDNEYFPLVPGTLRRFEGQTDAGLEVTEIEVLAETRLVAGIECVVVRDTVTVGGRIVEDTRDWYAQDDGGNVWYMGEAVDEYVYDDQGNMLEITHGGSWEAGIDVDGTGVSAAPGYQMPATLAPQDSYHQEYYEGTAEDLAYVVATRLTVELPDGTRYGDCVQMLEWAPLEPAALEYKYFAPGVGLVMEVPLGAEDETVGLVSG